MEKEMINSIYRHYKGGLYKLLFIATDKVTDTKSVVYQSITFGSYYTRPYSEWVEVIDNNIPRFTLIHFATNDDIRKQIELLTNTCNKLGIDISNITTNDITFKYAKLRAAYAESVEGNYSINKDSELRALLKKCKDLGIDVIFNADGHGMLDFDNKAVIYKHDSIDSIISNLSRAIDSKKEKPFDIAKKIYESL